MANHSIVIGLQLAEKLDWKEKAEYFEKQN